MALLAEELVEEWLRRQGFFTIRGARLKVHEIDLLAIGLEEGQLVRRHIEVQASPRPMKYITGLAREFRQTTGRSANSAVKRDDDTLEQSVHEWIEKKFNLQDKRDLMQRLAPGDWTRELVVYNVKHSQELELIRGHGITIWTLEQVVAEMSNPKRKPILGQAAGSDLLDLVALGRDGFSG
jgi:hypothetical protein